MGGTPGLTVDNGAAQQYHTLEQRKLLGFQNEQKIRGLIAWKEKEAAEAIKLLELRVSKLAESFLGLTTKLADMHSSVAPAPANADVLAKNAGISAAYGPAACELTLSRELPQPPGNDRFA